MKKNSLCIVMILVCSACNALFGQDNVPVNSTFRIFQQSDLTNPANNSFNRPGFSLPAVLVNAVIVGDLEAYNMINFAEINPVKFQQFDNRLIIYHELEQLTWADEWDLDSEYFYDDEVYNEGVIYRCIKDNSGISPDTGVDNWEVSPASLLNPELMTHVFVDYTLGVDDAGTVHKQYNYLHFLYEDEISEGKYYLMSFRFDDCLSVLENINLPWYQEAYPEWGWLTGKIFICNAWSNSLGAMAKDVYRMGTEGRIPFKKSAIREDGIPWNDEYATANFGVSFDESRTESNAEIYYMATKLAEFNMDDLLKVFPLSEITFQGFSSYALALVVSKLMPEDELPYDTLSTDGSFVTDINGTTLAKYFSEMELPEADPFSAGQSLTPTDLPTGEPWEGNYNMRSAVEYMLDTDANKFINEPGKEVSAILIEAIRNNGITNLYMDRSLTCTISKKEFIERITIPDWEMEELFRELSEWDPEHNYLLGDKVRISNVIYESLGDFNRDNPPASSVGFWSGEVMALDILFYEYEAFNKLEIVYNTVFNPEGQILSITPEALQLVIGVDYSENDSEIATGYLAFSDCERVFRKSEYAFAKAGNNQVNYADIIRNGELKGITIFSGHIEYHQKE